jgi:hypothetical protein
MTRVRDFAVEFVEFVPSELAQGVLYLSMQFATAVHACACGCGNKVVTPFTPTDWTMTFDGVSVSLHPSVGNWNFPCRSHYWIKRSRVRWASRWSEAEVRSGRTADGRAKREYFEGSTDRNDGLDPGRDGGAGSLLGLWSRLRRKVRRK